MAWRGAMACLLRTKQTPSTPTRAVLVQLLPLGGDGGCSAAPHDPGRGRGPRRVRAARAGRDRVGAGGSNLRGDDPAKTRAHAGGGGGEEDKGVVIRSWGRGRTEGARGTRMNQDHERVK